MTTEKSKQMNDTSKREMKGKDVSHKKAVHHETPCQETTRRETSSPGECDTLSKELDACRISVKEWQEKYARLSADLENFKRRIAKEQRDWAETAQADIIIQLLAITDNFDRAMEHKEQQSPEEMQSWADGITMIYNALGEFLKKAGVREMSYDTFDPSYHEALLQVDSDEHKSGAIVAVVEKGYLLNDRVLRPAKVSVAK